jgi:hypothetical protein
MIKRGKNLNKFVVSLPELFFYLSSEGEEKEP